VTPRHQQRVEQTTLDWLDVKYDVSKVHGKVVDLNRTVGGVINKLLNATSLLHQFGGQLKEVVGGVKNATKAVFDSLKTSWSTTDLVIMGLATLLAGFFIGVVFSTLTVSNPFYLQMIVNSMIFDLYSLYIYIVVANLQRYSSYFHFCSDSEKYGTP
jgi:hypothetical protein